MPLTPPTTVEQFVEAFLDFEFKSNQSIRERMFHENDAKGDILKSELAMVVQDFQASFHTKSKLGSISSLDFSFNAVIASEALSVSAPAASFELDANAATPSHTPREEALSLSFNPFDLKTKTLSTVFMDELQKQYSFNLIRRNPGKTLAAGLGTVFGTFAIPLIVLFALNAITGMSVISGGLPFLAALGPIGAVLAFAGLIAAASLVIFAVTVSITAANTKPRALNFTEDELEHDMTPSPNLYSSNLMEVDAQPNADLERQRQEETRRLVEYTNKITEALLARADTAFVRGYESKSLDNQVPRAQS